MAAGVLGKERLAVGRLGHARENPEQDKVGGLEHGHSRDVSLGRDVPLDQRTQLLNRQAESPRRFVFGILGPHFRFAQHLFRTRPMLIVGEAAPPPNQAERLTASAD